MWRCGEDWAPGPGRGFGTAGAGIRLDLVVVSLNRLVLQPQEEPAWGLLPLKSKQLPASVQLYLKPSGQLDSLSRAVQKGAAQIRRGLAPGAKQKDKLRDADLVAGALRDWLDINLPLDPSVDWARQSALDEREAWPQGLGHPGGVTESQSDQDGRGPGGGGPAARAQGAGPGGLGPRALDGPVLARPAAGQGKAPAQGAERP